MNPFARALVLTCVALVAFAGGTMKLSSPSFQPNAPIPVKFTCQGEDLAPELLWSGVPPEAKSLALVVDDPDAPDPKAPRMRWVHWIAFNLPPTSSGLREGGRLPAGAEPGLNDWKKPAWGGPCPPIGRHRYFFKLYALDTQLHLSHPTRAQLEAAMQGHVLAEAELIGTYEKH